MSVPATAARAVRAAGVAAPARPLTLPPRPRRVSGPARRGVADRAARRGAEGETGIALGLIGALDRLSRRRAPSGRTWIGLVAFALIGIVTLQLGLLKLNAGIGRAIEHEAVLQRENAALSIENSEMANSSRITAWAARQGMEPVPMESLRFLAARPGIDVTRAAAALRASARAAAAGSGEAPGAAAPAPSASASSATATAEQSTAGTATSSTGEASSAASASSAGESSAAAPAPAAASGESSARATEAAAAQPAESTQAAASTPAAGAAAPSGSAEGAPGGGTRASPAG